MHRTVHTWAGFRIAWDGVCNFLMDGQCVPFAFDLPPISEVVDVLRRDDAVRITPGTYGDTLLMDDIRQTFRALPIDEAMRQKFAIGHFNLENFYSQGQLLHGFEQRVLDPWRNALAAQGFTWERCYPIIFISGAGCSTNFHMDYSHVLAWQIYGNKRFCGLRDPDRWAPHDVRVVYDPGKFRRPPELTDADALCYDMPPGSVLWNALLTPHWVDAGDEVAMSINLSHRGLRLNGKLFKHEQELHEYRAKHEATSH